MGLKERSPHQSGDIPKMWGHSQHKRDIISPQSKFCSLPLCALHGSCSDVLHRTNSLACSKQEFKEALTCSTKRT
jgi:hypothetical protein